MKPETWRPLLTGETAKRAREAIDAIVSAIESNGGKQDASLAGGAAGLAVFHGYRSLARIGRGSARAAKRCLDRAGNAVASVAMPPSLYGGFTGVAWAMAHLGRTVGDGLAYSTEAVDEALKAYVRRPGWAADYDLVSGLVGFGVYALERLPNPAAAACLEGIVDRLAETARSAAGGTTWRTSPRLLPEHQRKDAPRGYDNLGLAHGVPGVIVLLAAAHAAGVRPRKARALLDGAVMWLLRQERHEPGSCFSAWIVPGGTREDCRTAWCYGDAGVAAALFCAARATGEGEWERKALEIARHAARRPPEKAGVVDAGLCHGAAGLGHVFNRFFQATGEEAFAGAARFWFERALDMRKPREGVGGYLALGIKEDGTRYWEDDPGILSGAAGIALALLAATTSIESKWDRMLLLSTQPPNHG